MAVLSSFLWLLIFKEISLTVVYFQN